MVNAGVEQGKRIVWEQVSVGEVDPNSEEEVAAKTQEMEDAFTTRKIAFYDAQITTLINLCYANESDIKKSVISSKNLRI